MTKRIILFTTLFLFLSCLFYADISIPDKKEIKVKFSITSVEDVSAEKLLYFLAYASNGSELIVDFSLDHYTAIKKTDSSFSYYYEITFNNGNRVNATEAEFAQILYDFIYYKNNLKIPY
jgi:hypothetical protein